MARKPATSRDPVERVAAGTVYLVLSLGLFVLWLWIGLAALLLLSLPTAVAGLVSLSVGWPRLRRELARERRDRSRGTPSPPRPSAP